MANRRSCGVQPRDDASRDASDMYVDVVLKPPVGALAYVRIRLLRRGELVTTIILRAQPWTRRCHPALLASRSVGMPAGRSLRSTRRRARRSSKPSRAAATWQSFAYGSRPHGA